jgi:hypothetical protein
MEMAPLPMSRRRPVSSRTGCAGAQAVHFWIMTGTAISTCLCATTLRWIRKPFLPPTKHTSVSGKAFPPCAGRGVLPAIPTCSITTTEMAPLPTCLRNRGFLNLALDTRLLPSPTTLIMTVAGHLCRGGLRTEHPFQEQS